MSGRIRYSEGLIHSCERSLRSAFQQPTLRLTRRVQRQVGDFNVEIEDPQRFATADEDSAQQPIAGVLTEAVWKETFWFNFKATFVLWAPTSSSARSHIMDHASITVFQDLAAGELGPCFRADWDPRAVQDGTSTHAQPHWHFVQRPETIESIIRTLTAPTGEFNPENKSEIFVGVAELSRFHFAMSPLWHESDKVPHKTWFDSDAFESWFANLVDYIAKQLVYVCGKSRGSIALKAFAAEATLPPDQAEVQSLTEFGNDPL
jgi:hypothetical protein